MSNHTPNLIRAEFLHKLTIHCEFKRACETPPEGYKIKDLWKLTCKNLDKIDDLYKLIQDVMNATLP